MAGVHYCNMPCRFNDNDEQRCDGSPVAHVDRRCLSFRTRPPKDDIRDMMRTEMPVYHKDSPNSRKIMGLRK